MFKAIKKEIFNKNPTENTVSVFPSWFVICTPPFVLFRVTRGLKSTPTVLLKRLKHANSKRKALLEIWIRNVHAVTQQSKPWNQNTAATPTGSGRSSFIQQREGGVSPECRRAFVFIWFTKYSGLSGSAFETLSGRNGGKRKKAEKKVGRGRWKEKCSAERKRFICVPDRCQHSSKPGVQ